MSHCCHKGFHLILNLPFQLRFRINSVVFPRQPVEQLWSVWIQLLLAAVFSDFQKHLHGLLKTRVKHWAGQEHDVYKELKILKKYFSSHPHCHIRQDLTRRLSANAPVSAEKLCITECVHSLKDSVNATLGQAKNQKDSA